MDFEDLVCRFLLDKEKDSHILKITWQLLRRRRNFHVWVAVRNSVLSYFCSAHNSNRYDINLQPASISDLEIYTLVRSILDLSSMNIISETVACLLTEGNERLPVC